MNPRYSSGLVAAIIVLAAARASSAGTVNRALPYPRVRSAVERACRAYTAYDRDHDGTQEIEFVRPAKCAAGPWNARGSGAGTVLVFVESRLWHPSPVNRQPSSLQPSLVTYIRDLGSQGYNAFLVEASLYAGPMHQDGLTTLAVRDFLRAVNAESHDLKVAILVGKFPSGFLVRQYYWRRTDSLTLHAGTKAEEHWDAVPHVRSIAEAVAKPFDLVLADLDGCWESLYHKGSERIGCLYAAFPEDPKQLVTSHFAYSAERYEDFFLVQDGIWKETPTADGKRVFNFYGEPNDECAPNDRLQTNIIARPDIAIGRIDASHAAVVPDPKIHGVHGEALLDSAGHPQAVEFAASSLPHMSDIWVPSESLERRLLVEFFDRDHRYRQGAYKDGLLPASIASEWGSSVPEMKQCVAGWSAADSAGREFTGGSVTISDFVSWMKEPALARAVKAHSNAVCSVFGNPPDETAFEEAVGPQIWEWAHEGNRLVPSLKGSGGQINFGLMRSLYENHALPDCPNLWFHTGCEAVMPSNYDTEPYSSPKYGRGQVAEAMLFYGNGLALVGRGKVFYDEPREFWKVLGQGGTWGDAWKHYFDVEGGDSELAKDGIGRKRAYFWSLLGDVTLTLPKGLTAKK